MTGFAGNFHCCAEIKVLALLCWYRDAFITMLALKSFQCCAGIDMLSLLCWHNFTIALA